MKILRLLILIWCMSSSIINAADLDIKFSYSDLDTGKTYKITKKMDINRPHAFSAGEFDFFLVPLYQNKEELSLGLKIVKNLQPLWYFENPPLVFSWKHSTNFNLGGENYDMSITFMATNPNTSCMQRVEFKY